MEIAEQFPYQLASTQGVLTTFDSNINYVQLKLQLSPSAGKKLDTVNTSQHIIIAIDKSGSMSGSPIENSKIGIEDMVAFLNQNNIRKVTIVSYQSSAYIQDLEGLTSEQQKQIIKGIHASGGTSFGAAFRKIQESVQNHKSTDVKVVFFTDGEDGSARSSLPSFREFFKSVPQSEFHTIGFNSSHDADLLNQITKIGSNSGTFQYCKASADIKTCVESIAGIIGCGSSLKGCLMQNGKQVAIETDVFTDEQTKKVNITSNLFLTDAEIGNGLLLKIMYGSSEKFLEVKKSDLKTSEVSNASDPLIMTLNYVKHEVAKLLLEATKLRDSKGNFDKSMYDHILEQISLKDKKLDQLNEEGSKLKLKDKKEFYPLLMETKELVAEFYGKLKDLQSGMLNNDKIAALNALAYRGVTKKALQKKLDVRTQNNVGVINNVYSKVKEITKELDFEQLRKEYDELAKELGPCVFSSNDFIQCLKEEDCLCITYDVARSQAAIMDPTQILIKDVFPTQISVSSFMFSAEYALKGNNMAHGGFSKSSQGSIIKGVAREDITGVLPLYICKENWPIAKQLMKPALGWTVTLDPLGYAFSQVATVPFLVLAKLYEMYFKQPTQFVKLQIKWVEQTCEQIIKDASHQSFENKMNVEIINKFKPYLSDPASRTVDQIASNKVFLVQLHLLIKMGMLAPLSQQDASKFRDYVLEEQLRRRANGFGDLAASEVNKYIYKLLNIDLQKYVNDPFKKFLESLKKQKDSGQSQYAIRFLNAYNNVLEKKGMQKVPLAAKATEVVQQKEQPQSKPDLKEQVIFDIKLRDVNGNYNETQTKATQELNDYKKKIWSTMILFRHFGVEIKEEEPFVLNPQSEYFLLGLYLQNKLNSKNSDRRDSITNKHYVNPFTNARDYVENMYKVKATEEKNRRITEAQNEMLGNAYSALAQTFYQTKDLNEAAGCLMGAFIGVNTFYFYKALCQGGSPQFKTKLMMLTWGGYKGVKFYADNYKVAQAPPLWNICRRKSNKLLENNAQELTREEWRKILPKLSSINICLKKGEPIVLDAGEPERGEKKKDQKP